MRIAIGTMMGTSMDAVDAAAITIDGSGLAMQVAMVDYASLPLADLADALRPIAAGAGGGEGLLADLAMRIGRLHAEVIGSLDLPGPPDLVALHGQTLRHAPPLALHLIDPTPVGQLVDCPVLHDPRADDLALGGQGAPITPLADWVLFRDANRHTDVVNLGGYCNVTSIGPGASPQSTEGFDVCCCNLLLDAIARSSLDAPYDSGGAAALAGTVDHALCHDLYVRLDAQRTASRALADGDDCSSWLLGAGAHLGGPDLAATATAAIGRCIAAALGEGDVLLAGGGSKNDALVEAIGRESTTTAARGVPPEARESVAMAVLGALSMDDVAITLPQVTGRRTDGQPPGFAQLRP